MIQQLTTQEHLARLFVLTIGGTPESVEQLKYYHDQFLKTINYLQQNLTKKSQTRLFIELIEEIAITEENIDRLKLDMVITTLLQDLGENDL